MQSHIPVLVSEVIESLKPKKNENFIDATVGFGGHALEILKKTAPDGRLLAIDQDPVALGEAKKYLKNHLSRVDFALTNFAELGLVIRDWQVSGVSGILFDLGVSTYQLTSEDRGFSFRGDAILDMRMSPARPKTAESIVNKASFQELKRILKIYGEEPFAGKIASAIVAERSKKPITRVNELVAVIEGAIPDRFKTRPHRLAKHGGQAGKTHFATKTFQALRIATNDELAVLASGLKQALQVLSPGGRIAVISFHSLEDRIVKKFFAENDLAILTPKPLQPSLDEIARNPRSRSAKLRAAVKK